MPYKDPAKASAHAAEYHAAHKNDEAYKQRQREKSKRYRQKHPEKVRAIWQASNDARKDDPIHKEKARIRTKAWRTENREHARIASRIRYRANTEEILAWQKAYYQTHKADKATYDAKYRKANQPKHSAADQRRRANKSLTTSNTLTLAQWEEIKTIYGHRCVYCGRKMKRLTQDHLTPLRQQGEHTASNIVPACVSCNSKKHTGPVLKPVQPVLLTIAPARKERHTK
jgi:HNH endonuclease